MKLLAELLNEMKVTPEVAAEVYHRDYLKTKKARKKRYLDTKKKQNKD